MLLAVLLLTFFGFSSKNQSQVIANTMWRRGSARARVGVCSSVVRSRATLAEKKGRYSSTTTDGEPKSWGPTLAVLTVAGCAGGAFLYFNPEQRDSLLHAIWPKKEEAKDRTRKVPQPAFEAPLPAFEAPKPSHQHQEDATHQNSAADTSVARNDETVHIPENQPTPTEDAPDHAQGVTGGVLEIDDEKEHQLSIATTTATEDITHDQVEDEQTHQEQQHQSTVPLYDISLQANDAPLAEPEPTIQTSQEASPSHQDTISSPSPTVGEPQRELPPAPVPVLAAVEEQQPESPAPPVKQKKPKTPNPYLQPSASPELFRDIFTMQKETYEKQLAEKDAKLARKLEKQKQLLKHQHERDLERVSQEKKQEYERFERNLLESYQEQIAQLQEERKQIAAEAQAFVDAEMKKLDDKKQELIEKLNVIIHTHTHTRKCMQADWPWHKSFNLSCKRISRYVNK